jgi:hypothetical protein
MVLSLQTGFANPRALLTLWSDNLLNFSVLSCFPVFVLYKQRLHLRIFLTTVLLSEFAFSIFWGHPVTQTMEIHGVCMLPKMPLELIELG